VAGLVNIEAGSLLSGIGALAKDIRAAITGKSIINAEQAAQLALKASEIEAGVLNAQSAINQVEAASPSLFVAGWRPFIGWVCGAAFLYASAYSLICWFAALCAVVAPPAIDTNIFQTVLFGMLGLATNRTYEKTKLGG
jgi:hypothetical protein